MNLQRIMKKSIRQSHMALSYIAPRFVAETVKYKMFKPLKTPLKPIHRQYLSQAKAGQINFKNKTIKYWKWGQGPTVLLVHGWSGQGIHLSSYIAPLIQQGYSVMTYDHPAHGQSSGKFTNLVEMTEVLTKVISKIDHLKAVVAHSFGATAVSNYLRQGHEIEKAVFIGAVSNIETPIRLTLQQLGVRQQVLNLIKDDFEERYHVDWDSLSPLDFAHQMKTPLLLIHDQADLDVSWIQSENLNFLWPGSKLVTTDGLGHHKILRSKDVIRRTIDFILGDAA